MRRGANGCAYKPKFKDEDLCKEEVLFTEQKSKKKKSKKVLLVDEPPTHEIKISEVEAHEERQLITEPVEIDHSDK